MAPTHLPLRRDEIGITLLQPQMPVFGDAGRLGSAALAALLRRIDAVQKTPGGASDVVHLGPFPQRELQPWTAREAEQVAIDLHGPELRALAASARRHRCYLTLECLTRDPDWPGLIVRMGLVLGPDGSVVGRQWQHDRPAGTGYRGWTPTTIADVRPAYIARYGKEAALPVIRTDAGNIAFSADGDTPSIHATHALNGAEIMIFASTTSRAGEGSDHAAAAWQVFAIGQAQRPIDPDGAITEAGDTMRVAAAFDPHGVALPGVGVAGADATRVRLALGRLREMRRGLPAGRTAPAPAMRSLTSDDA